MDDITLKLFKAIENKNYPQIKSLIAAGADLAAENENKQTAIQFAYQIDTKCVEAIATSKNTDVNDTYRYGFPLVLACQEGQKKIAICLLKAGASQTWASQPSNNNALHWAIKYHGTTINQTLLEKTLLDNAEFIKLLLGGNSNIALAQKNKEKFTPIHLAARLNHWTLIETIVQIKQTDAEDTYDYGSAFLEAVKQNRLETAKALLKAKCKLTWYTLSDKNSCLHWAVLKNNLSMVALLLEYCASTKEINLAGQTPLELACAKGHWDCALLLLEAKQFNIMDHSKAGLAYIEAVKAGQLLVANLLQKAGAPTCEKTPKEGNTALHALTLSWNKLNNNNLVLNFVLEHGAQLQTVTNHAGKTPIELASENGFGDCVQRLIKYNHPTLKDKSQAKQLILDLHLEKVLVNFIKLGNYAITKLLLNHGTPCNSWNSELGNIPLYWAVTKDRADIVELLLHYGANPKIKNKDSKTTFDLAQNHPSCLKHLHSHKEGSFAINKSTLLESLTKDRDATCKKMQKIIDDDIRPEELPELIKKINRAYLRIMQGDKLLLRKQRKNLHMNTPLQTNTFFQTNGYLAPDKLTQLIQIINTLLKSPYSQSPQLNCELNLNDALELDIANFLSFKQNSNCYLQRVHIFLLELVQEIDKTQWCTSFFGLDIQHKPEPVAIIEKILIQYFKEPRLEKILNIYAEVLRLVNQIPQIEGNHENTDKFYRNISAKIVNMTFWGQSHEPNPRTMVANSEYTYQASAQSDQNFYYSIPVYTDYGDSLRNFV